MAGGSGATVNLTGSQTITGTKDFIGGVTVNGTAIVLVNDSRLTDTRTPTDGTVTDTKIAVGGLSPSKITGTAVITSDARLSDPRTPTPHASTHYPGGSDPLTYSLSGTLAARPAASSSNAGMLYLATNDNGGTTYRSNGSTWAAIGAGVNGSAPTGTAGGDLTGNYPNPTITNNAVTPDKLLTGSSSGQVPLSDGASSWTWIDPATQSELDTHTGATTSVHGISNTANLMYKTTVTAKGDLIAATGNATVARQAIGSNGQVLIADSSKSTGMRWGTDYSNSFLLMGS